MTSKEERYEWKNAHHTGNDVERQRNVCPGARVHRHGANCDLTARRWTTTKSKLVLVTEAAVVARSTHGVCSVQDDLRISD